MSSWAAESTDRRINSDAGWQTHAHTHMLLRPDVWDRMTLQRSHKWSLTLTRKSKQAVCLICPIQCILLKKKIKKKTLSGSLIGHILEVALGLDQYYCAWRVSPPQSKEPPTLTPAPKNPTGKAFCPPSLIKNSPATNAEGENELSYFVSVLWKRKRFTSMPFKFGFFFSTILSYILLCAAQVADVSLFGQ